MSMKAPSPLLGYNNNVRHNGKVFHIQTEDSGVKYGHIITHLFMDGGRILKSVKTSYAEYIGNERVGDIVREMMKQQHKAMFIALRDGKFDALAEGKELSGTRSLLTDSAPKPPPVPSGHKVPPPLPRAKVLTPAPPAPAHDAEAPPTIRQPPPAELTLDIDALERAVSPPAGPALHAASDLPPPPTNLFREKAGAGKHRVTPGPAAAPPAAATAPAPPDAAAAAARKPAAAPTQADRRYAPTRPAAIFGQARPQQGKSIFGEDLISDKSLDEVILSYLAEDLEEKK
jgi:hypothetical protein